VGFWSRLWSGTVLVDGGDVEEIDYGDHGGGDASFTVYDDGERSVVIEDYWCRWNIHRYIYPDGSYYEETEGDPDADEENVYNYFIDWDGNLY
jgi:hypothetical protein